MQTVLLVEDDSERLRRLEEAAGGDDRRLLKSQNLQDALDVIRRENLDLVVTDLRLDEENQDNREGFTVLNAAREKDPTLPVILISSYLTDEQTPAAIKLGVFDIIDRASPRTKPYELLRLKIKQALQFRQFQRVA